VKLKDFHDTTPNPDRLMIPAPRGRQGLRPNGGNTFERINVDEAIAEAASAGARSSQKYGAAGIHAAQSYLGNMVWAEASTRADPLFQFASARRVNEKNIGRIPGSSTACAADATVPRGGRRSGKLRALQVVHRYLGLTNSISTNLHTGPSARSGKSAEPSRRHRFLQVAPSNGRRRHNLAPSLAPEAR